ncbi:LrgB family protein [Caenispirillum salinarum]|uniref:LrgB family protein n=1 Tax=Caenispirillum salinarum TaxID=859058 RepID=UPI00384EA8CB
MGEDLYQIWVYLAAEPLTGLFVTLVAYRLGLALFERAGRPPILNPVLTAVLLIVGLLTVTDVDYSAYFEGAQFVHFLLGPATVALAIPLYNQLSSVRRSLPALAAAILVGSVTAAGSAVAVAWVLDASPQTVISLAPKSVTTPIAMGVAERLGGLPSLTAVLVILSGILGAIAGPGLLKLVGVRDDRAGGVAMGTASHGIGTARALQTGEVAGAFSGLAMGLNGLATAVLLPLLYALFMAGDTP